MRLQLTFTKEVHIEGTIHQIREIGLEFSPEKLKSAIEGNSHRLIDLNRRIRAVVDIVREATVRQLVPAYLDELFEFMRGSPSPSLKALATTTIHHSLSVYFPRSRWTQQV